MAAALARRRGRAHAAARAAAGAFALAAALMAVLALLHLKAARPLLARLARVGGACPVRPLTPAEVERAQAFSTSIYAGKPRAPARPALVFAFESTTLADVEAWARRFGVACEAINGSETLRSCDAVSAEALGQPAWFGPAEASFAFHPDRTLSTLTVFRRRLAVAHANALTAEVGRRLRGALGHPPLSGGENSAEHFARGPAQAFKEEWQFGDYGAALGEARLGPKGVSVREHYVSAAFTSPAPRADARRLSRGYSGPRRVAETRGVGIFSLMIPSCLRRSPAALSSLAPRRPLWLAFFSCALVAAACGDEGGAPPVPLATPTTPAPAPPAPAAPACVPVCAEGACPASGCCPAPGANNEVRLPAHVTWTDFSFEQPGLSELEVSVDIENNPGTQVGLYFAPASGFIDDAQMYFGLQTSLARPGVGAVGKGFIFSQFGTLDRSAIRTAPGPGGFFERGTHEGDFIGVRLDRPWSSGRYVLRLVRAEAEGEADWFEYRVREEATCDEFSVGALRFARRSAGSPATIAPTLTAFTEVYSGAERYDQVPRLDLAFRAVGDGRGPLWAHSDYPAFPWAEYPYSDQWYEPASGLIRIAFGGGTPRCHERGPLFMPSPRSP